MVVHLAWHDGDLVAGHIGSFAGDTAVYLLGASTRKGRDLRASYLLQWKVIEHAISNGNDYYDLGGIDQNENPNVYRFKKRLNGRLVKEIGAYEFAPGPLASRILGLLEYSYGALRARRRKTAQA
jgi:lipid II:glycine glycyltransferase (peptidoglycan interpeptide bridge formation enzyme)